MGKPKFMVKVHSSDMDRESNSFKAACLEGSERCGSRPRSLRCANDSRAVKNSTRERTRAIIQRSACTLRSHLDAVVLLEGAAQRVDDVIG